MLLYGGAENALVNEMVTKAKIEYVTKHHDNAITQIKKGALKGRWKTYYGHGKERIQVTSSSKDKLLISLYDKFYSKESFDNLVTFEKVFDLMIRDKKALDNVTDQTILLEKGMATKHLADIEGKEITQITSEDLKKLYSRVASDVGKDKLRRIYQLISRVFVYAMDKGITSSNPNATIDISRYFKSCIASRKPADAQQFSNTQIDILADFAKKNLSNPRALMMLLSISTGMRVGELSALKWIDVTGDVLLIRRQQVIRGGAITYTEYTKDERMDPKGGRFFPITNDIHKTLSYIKEYIGVKGEFVFHDSKGCAITKTSYELYLKRVCIRLFKDKYDTFPTNNHAFRKALNSRMANRGIGLITRASLLGHSPETNEKKYLLLDNRVVDGKAYTQLNESILKA